MRESDRNLLIAVLVSAAVLGVLILSAICSLGAELAGNTVEIYAIFRDSDGVAVVPDSAWGFVFRDGTAIDSSASLHGGQITRYHRVLKWRYTIPSAAADSSRFAFFMRAKDATIVDDWLPCIPASISLMDAITDSISPAASVDYAVGEASTSWAVVDSTEGGGIYSSGGAAITGAFVYVTSDSTLTDFIGFGKSTLGNYYIWVPMDAAAADTMYVSAWYQNNWLKLWSQVIDPE